MEQFIRSQDFEARWGENLANHMPMALLSLRGLGFEDDVLQSFSDFYQRRLSALPKSQGRIGRENWREHLGEYEFLSDYGVYFSDQIRRYGLHEVFIHHLPILVDDMISDGFHPLIRLAFGVDFDLIEEQAMALAYWAAVYQSRPVPSVGQHRDVWAVFANFSELGLEPIRQGLISERLEQAIVQPEFRKRIHVDVVQACSLDDVREVALRLHWARNNIVSLHAVTSVHGARVLIDAVPELRASIVAHLAYGIAAMVWAEGAPALVDIPEEAESEAWDDLREGVRDSRNDHAIKLMYSCQEEWQHYDDPRYQQMASRIR